MMPIPTVTIPTLVIQDRSERFPVRRIFCVGQNYADHAREMGSDPLRKPPFFFAKPGDAIVSTGTRLVYPSQTRELHHEVELVIAMGGGGVDIEPDAACGLIFGWAVGIDLTRRDLQAEAKKTGRPWEMAKGFDFSAPVGPLVIGNPPSEATIELAVDDEPRQSGNLADMIWPVADIIAKLSSYVRVAPGDLIFTGTPSGVGPIQRGNRVSGVIAGALPVEISFQS